MISIKKKSKSKMERIFKNIISTVIGIVLIFSGINMEFSDWIRVFLILIGIVMIFSKDTLISKIGKIIDSVISFFNKKE